MGSLFGGEDEVFVGSADESDIRLAGVSQRRQQAPALEMLERDGPGMSRITGNPLLRRLPRSERLDSDSIR